jgi:hypothetical protein
MHAALGFLLILTIHRCYPAGVPRCLQGNFIRRQIRQHLQTLCFIWAFAILINLPLFAITEYDSNSTAMTGNTSNQTESLSQSPTCETEATKLWSRTYLILLLVSTYLITGIFLIVIYGQVIRILLASKKYAQQNRVETAENSSFLSPNVHHKTDPYRTSPARSSTTLASTNVNHRHQHLHSTRKLPMSLIIQKRELNRTATTTTTTTTTTTAAVTNSHSTQHLQVIIMLFIVILLYILLLLPYRLLNLLYIVHNQLFQQNFMNETLFQCLLNTVRLLVFLNCALQPITYIIISSRLRQTVIKFLQACWYQCSCRCRCVFDAHHDERYSHETRAVHAYLTQKYPSATQRYQQTHKRTIPYREHQPSANNIQLMNYPPVPLTRPAMLPSHLTANRIPYTVTFMNTARK